MLVLYIILGVVGFLLILLLVLTFFLYKILLYSPLKDQNNDYKLYDSPQFAGKEDLIIGMINRLRSIPFKDIFAESYDKLELHARLLQVEHSNKAAILFHGYRGTALRDFCGAAMELYSLGYNIILVDERAHGESEGHKITFGKRERKDVLTWISKAKSLLGRDAEIVLMGVSMGGATVLYASEFIDKNIKVIADCPYSTPEEVIGSGIKKLGLSVKFFSPLINLSSLIWCHSNLWGLDASKSVKNSQCKFLIIHGDADSVVNYKFSKRIYLENRDKVQYEQFTDADHGLSYIVDDERYTKIVSEFLKK
ncbi:MAG: alpha/beta hydrolase [Bacilli bacterium]|nr:alpha/beta hydrolase [Bacilli bacterium]